MKVATLGVQQACTQFSCTSLYVLSLRVDAELSSYFPFSCLSASNPLIKPMTNINFEVILSFTDDKKPYQVGVVIPELGGVTDKTFSFSSFSDAMSLQYAYAHAFHKDPETILDFHLETKSKYEAGELQTKMKI